VTATGRDGAAWSVGPAVMLVAMLEPVAGALAARAEKR
jgi:hypothetical protein